MVLVAVIGLLVCACSVGNPLFDDDAATGEEASTPDGNGESDDSSAEGGGVDGGEDETTDQADSDQEPDGDGPVDPLVEPAAATVEQVASLPGLLAIGSDMRLSINEPGGTELQVLDEGIESAALQPVWSDLGAKLAWSRVSADGHEVIVTDVGGGQPDIATPLAGPPAFYFQWSADGRTIAYLRNAQNGRGVELGLVAPGADTAIIGTVAPFFIHWSPVDAAALAAHVGGAQVVELSDPRSALDGAIVETSVLLEQTAAFSTPTWIDERTVLGADSTGLVLVDVETTQTGTVVSFDGLSRQVRFVVSPDRTKVAYQLDRGEGGPAVVSAPVDRHAEGLVSISVASPAAVDAESGLVIVDLVTETSEVVTLDPVLRWEWSPTSDRLAWMEPIPSAADRLVRWNFWTDPETPVVKTPIHHITDVVAQAYLPFFEQYVHSVTGWSPDGSAFAFAGRHQAEPPDAPDSIWVQLIVADTPPARVAEGDVVTWSP